MLKKIALAGNPNSGKTTIFNALTGSNQYVGNWPGVTVEKKEGYLKAHPNVVVVDLPGIYSLSPYTLEEQVARQYLSDQPPAAVINLVDAANLERNLYLTVQLTELGIPLVVALNMMDVVAKRGDKLDTKLLSQQLGCPCFEISALKNQGVDRLVAHTVSNLNTTNSPLQIKYSPKLESTLEVITLLIADYFPAQSLRAAAINIFEGAAYKTEPELPAQTIAIIKEVVALLEDELGDTAESIMADNRYAFIEKVIAKCLKTQKHGSTPQQHIDDILTNKYLAFPIFFLVMFGVYYLSINLTGQVVSKFAAQNIFYSHLILPMKAVLLHKGVNATLVSLLADGVVRGVSSVLSFLPQLAVLFLLLSVLEDCGYMARTAFIMDKIFSGLGLSGKSFISLLIGSGCSVPGIMASRTVAEESERKITIITTPFIPCGAKMPVIALFAGVFFGGAWWVAPLAYFLGIFAVAYSGLVLQKIPFLKGASTPFIMELPPYRLPSAKNIFLSTWTRCASFIKKAGTVILLASVALWFFSNYGVADGRIFATEHLDQSIVAGIGRFFAPIFRPLGFGSWQATVATFLGLIAKEEIVSAFGVLFGAGEHAAAMLNNSSFAVFNSLPTHFGMLSAASFLIFNLLCAPCAAAVAAIKREMNSTFLTFFAVFYQTLLAYCTAFVVFQFGSYVTTGSFSRYTAAAALVLAGMIFALFVRPQRAKREVKFGQKSNPLQNNFTAKNKK